MCLLQPGVPAFTVKQPDGPMKVLQERAEEIGVRNTNMHFKYTLQNAVNLLTLFCISLSQCSLSVCPDLEEYQSEGSLRLGLAGHHQRSNASLALQLSHTWLQRHFLTGACF